MKYINVLLIFLTHNLLAQVPDNILNPPTDSYTMQVTYDQGYRIDSIEYSNGTVFYYGYDTLGNRFQYTNDPTPPKAELRLLLESIPDTLGRGISAVFDVDWRNSGSIPATNFRVAAFLSIDSILDATDVPSGITTYTNSLASTTTEMVATNINISPSTVSGQWYTLFLYIDDLNHIVEYSDSNNILATKVFIEECPIVPTLNESIAHQVCNLPNGSIALGLPEDYRIQWFNGSVDTSVSNLVSGDYSYTLTNTKNYCQYTDSIFIQDFPALQVQTIATHVNCNGNNGIAEAIPVSGYPPYTYTWAGSGLNTNVINNLPVGLYTVTVSDSTGCTDVFNISIEATPLPHSYIEKQDATCALANGTATATTIGGLPPYTYSWSNGQATPIATNLSGVNIYTLTTTDSTGCTHIEDIQILNIGNLTANITTTGNFLEVTPIGKTPFSYTWSTGATTSGIVALATGNYWVNIIDGNNCEWSDTIYFVQDTTENPNAISDLESATLFTAYPNPNNGQKLIIDTEIKNINKLQIINELGQIVLEKKVNKKPPYEWNLNNKVSKGTYYIRAIDAQEVQKAIRHFVIH